VKRDGSLVSNRVKMIGSGLFYVGHNIHFSPLPFHVQLSLSVLINNFLKIDTCRISPTSTVHVYKTPCFKSLCLVEFILASFKCIDCNDKKTSINDLP